MKAPRFTIAWVMAAVAIAALDLGAIRAVFGPTTGNLLLLGALPMANILAVGILIGRRCPGSRTFLLGFEAFGAIALALYVALVSFFPGIEVAYLAPFLKPIDTIIGRGRPLVYVPLACFSVAVMLGWPQAAFALIGGSLFRRFRSTSTPR